MIGGIVGNYRLTTQLGRGAMGVIYHAQHVHTEGTAAVQFLPRTGLSSSSWIQLKARLRREAFVQKQLDHPHIVRVYQFITVEDGFFWITEAVVGQSLRELLARQGTPTAMQAVKLCRQALDALHYAHHFKYLDESDLPQTGMLHRDLRPSTLLLDTKGRLKLADFGLARILHEQTGLPAEAESCNCWSPEQRRGQMLDARADLYSLGVVLHELVTGLPTVTRAEAAPVEVGLALTPSLLDLHPSLAAIIDRALRQHPAERFQSAAEFNAALQDCERLLSSESARPFVGAINDMTGLKTRVLSPAPNDQSAEKPSPVPAPPPSSCPLPVFAGDAQPLLPGIAPTPDESVEAYAVSPGIPAPSKTIEPKAFSDDLPDRYSVFSAKPQAASPSRRRWVTTAAVAALLLMASLGAYLAARSRTQPHLVPSARPNALMAATAIEAATIDVGNPSGGDAAAQGGPQTAYQRAQALIRRDQYEAAISVYREYLALNPAAPDAAQVNAQIASVKQAQVHLADAEAALAGGLFKLARSHFAQASRLQPNSQRARLGLSELDAKLGPSAAAAETQAANRPAPQAETVARPTDAPPIAAPDVPPTLNQSTTPSTGEVVATPTAEEPTVSGTDRRQQLTPDNAATSDSSTPAPPTFGETATPRRSNSRRKGAKPAKPAKSDPPSPAATRAN